MFSQFSEFSFGFALTHELCNRSGPLTIAPVLPSLIEEGADGGGYDLLLERPGLPLILQFKLSEYMLRSNAGEWAQFGRPYYRFWIYGRRHSKQNDLLLDLDGDRAEVLYAAPRFHELADLNSNFAASTVEQQSIFFAPSAIGRLMDDDSHPVAFEPNADHGYLFSEPARVNAQFASDGLMFALLPRITDGRLQHPTDDLFDGLYHAIIDKATMDLHDSRRPELARGLRSPSLVSRARAAVSARIFLGAELLWITTRQR